MNVPRNWTVKLDEGHAQTSTTQSTVRGGSEPRKVIPARAPVGTEDRRWAMLGIHPHVDPTSRICNTRGTTNLAEFYAVPGAPSPKKKKPVKLKSGVRAEWHCAAERDERVPGLC